MTTQQMHCFGCNKPIWLCWVWGDK